MITNNDRRVGDGLEPPVCREFLVKLGGHYTDCAAYCRVYENRDTLSERMGPHDPTSQKTCKTLCVMGIATCYNRMRKIEKDPVIGYIPKSVDGISKYRSMNPDEIARVTKIIRSKMMDAAKSLPSPIPPMPVHICDPTSAMDLT